MARDSGLRSSARLTLEGVTRVVFSGFRGPVWGEARPGLVVVAPAVCVALLSLVLLGCAGAAPPGTTGTPGRPIVVFHELRFELPGAGWHPVRDDPSMAQYSHKYGESRVMAFSIWPAGVPLQLRGSSQAELTRRYFDHERTLPRYHGTWGGFVEGEREIAGRRYPVMTFTVTYPPAQPVTPSGDGLFLIYFPDDFSERLRFYVVMWKNFRPAGERARGLQDLDALVSTLRVAR